MDLIDSKMDSRSDIRQFILNYLPTSRLHAEMQHATLELLHGKGKLFNEAEGYFTWSEFSYFIYSLFYKEDMQRNPAAIAAAIELLILASDIIDDLVDCDTKGNIFCILSEQKALTLSNALLMESFDLVNNFSKSDQTKRLSVIIKNLQIACNGQWRDLSFIIGDSLPTEQDYFQLIKQKSVPFIQLIFDLHHPEEDPILEEISTCIGFSGQIKNDAKDILSDKKSDLIHKKSTLPLIKAVEYSKEKDGGLLLDKLKLLDGKQINSHLLNEIKTYITHTGAIDYCLIIAKLYINRAKALLNQHFPDKRIYTEKLIKLLD